MKNIPLQRNLCKFVYRTILIFSIDQRKVTSWHYSFWYHHTQRGQLLNYRKPALEIWYIFLSCFTLGKKWYCSQRPIRYLPHKKVDSDIFVPNYVISSNYILPDWNSFDKLRGLHILTTVCVDTHTYFNMETKSSFRLHWTTQNDPQAMLFICIPIKDTTLIFWHFKCPQKLI